MFIKINLKKLLCSETKNMVIIFASLVYFSHSFIFKFVFNFFLYLEFWELCFVFHIVVLSILIIYNIF